MRLERGVTDNQLKVSFLTLKRKYTSVPSCSLELTAQNIVQRQTAFVSGQHAFLDHLIVRANVFQKKKLRQRFFQSSKRAHSFRFLAPTNRTGPMSLTHTVQSRPLNLGLSRKDLVLDARTSVPMTLSSSWFESLLPDPVQPSGCVLLLHKNTTQKSLIELWGEQMSVVWVCAQ